MTDRAAAFLPDGGAMGERVRRFDWSSTPLGPLPRWPAALKIAVSMVLSSNFPQALVWGSELITIYNDAFAPILGKKHDCLGRSFADIWAEAWHEIGPIAQRALRGESTFIENFALTIKRTELPEKAYFTFCYSPVRDESGLIRGFVDTVVETTAAVIAERSTRLLNSELVHRLQNTFAVVLGISQQTLRRADSIEGAQAALSERITALGRTHSLLAAGKFNSASIPALIEMSLSHVPREEHSISIDGPELELGAPQALTLALALNELVTNAMKYGALSEPGGALSISWKTDAGTFRLVWREREGPRVSEPTRRGFGSRIIQEMLPRDLGGQVSVEYAPEGLVVVLTADIHGLNAPQRA